MPKVAKTETGSAVKSQAISEVNVAGFKSISERAAIEIGPLTILAGVNSSGKSSMMQPLLLLKQTLEAPYDAGPILLHGPILKFTSADQLLSRTRDGQSLGNFRTGIRLDSGDWFETRFGKEHNRGFKIERTETSWEGKKLAYWPEMAHAEIVKTFKRSGIELSEAVPERFKEGQWEIKQDRCLVGPVWVAKPVNGTSVVIGARPGPKWEEIIPQVIYLPGLRGNPERTYPATAVGSAYPGTFEGYTASVISQWMAEGDDKLAALNADLNRLKLTGGVYADRINAAQIELYVGRLPDVSPEHKDDRINIADVGLGVSQTLPVLVALHAAKPGALVYVEQPETHLHPQAQFTLAQVLAAAAEREVRVVVETHSSMLLLGVQALVAEGKFPHDKVKLHWFRTDKNGRTTVASGDLDEAGAFGDWPQDFDDVELRSQKRYLDAASERLMSAKHG